MTYEMMESTLLERIADLRRSEADFSRSMARVRNGEIGIDLNAEYVRMDAQLNDVEKLIARMEGFEVAAPLSGVATPMNVALMAA
jgi:hypothetical protein